jgi:nucleoside 2-deoxyribosyltransferase
MTAELPRCYVASPLGFTSDGLVYLNERYLPALAQVVTPVNPWDLTSPEEISEAERTGTTAALRLEMGRRNAEAIDASPLLVAYLEGQELDSGTASEIGYASASGKRCYGLRTDLRRTGEPAGQVNLQVEYFILRSGGLVLTTLDELVVELRHAVAELASARA